MDNKITNPLLKQIISNIANKANEGRMKDINWNALSQPKKILKEVEKSEKDKLPDLGGADEKPTTDKSAPDTGEAEKDLGADKSPEEPAAPEAEADTGKDAEKAQADAVKAKAELEKAKAEKDQAEKEIKKQSYVKLGSGAGTQFLLGKILDQAFKTNTIDALASEMVQKLKIQTPEDMVSFSEDTAQLRVLPGMPELLASMKTMATKQPDASTEETP